MIEQHTTVYVCFEVPEEDWSDWGGTGGPLPLPGVDPLIVARYNALEFDGENCAVCQTGVGMLLLEQEHDYGTREYTTWRWVTIATNGRSAWLLCEECTTILDAED